MNLLNDTQFKADILSGYEALTELLKEFDDGAWIHKPSPSGGFHDASADDLNEVLDRLAVLREALNSLIIGKEPR